MSVWLFLYSALKNQSLNWLIRHRWYWLKVKLLKDSLQFKEGLHKPSPGWILEDLGRDCADALMRGGTLVVKANWKWKDFWDGVEALPHSLVKLKIMNQGTLYYEQIPFISPTITSLLEIQDPILCCNVIFFSVILQGPLKGRRVEDIQYEDVSKLAWGAKLCIREDFGFQKLLSDIFQADTRLYHVRVLILCVYVFIMYIDIKKQQTWFI